MTGAPTTAFIGVGYSAIERTSERSILDFALEAAIDALEDAGIARAQVDGYVGISKSITPSPLHEDGADEASAYLVTEHLGLEGLGWVGDVSGFAPDMAAAAANAILAGCCEYVLCVRAVYNFDQSTPRPQVAEAFGESQFKLPFGVGPGGTRFAMRLRSYLHRSGASRDDLYEIVSAARAHARNNPVAYFRDKDLTLEQYLGGRLIADPLNIYDCDLPVCAAGAFVMTSAERATGGNHPPAYFRAYANRHSAEEILERAGIGREDVQVCQLYDGYSFMVYEWLERLGFCPPDSAWKFVSAGATRPGGALPVNTFGGSLGEGRLHGMGHLREGIVQVMQRGGARQVPGVRNCLVQVGPFDRASLALLSVEPGPR